jgi:hypothetical protein
MVVGNGFELLYPFAIGLAVDGLLDDSWNGVALFAAISVAHTALIVVGQRLGTRTFNRLYGSLASDLVERQRAEGVGTSSVVARTALTGEYVDFLEVDVDAAITAAFAVVGSLVMLFLYDPVLGAVAAVVAVPVALLNRRLVRRSGRIYRRLNDQSELEVSLIETGSTDEVRRHFRVLAGHWIRLSDAEAVSWGVVDLFALGLAVFALVRTTDSSAEVGTIFAVIAYVWAYIGGFDQVPAVLQRMANLADIRRRLEGNSRPAGPEADCPT